MKISGDKGSIPTFGGAITLIIGLTSIDYPMLGITSLEGSIVVSAIGGAITGLGIYLLAK